MLEVIRDYYPIALLILILILIYVGICCIAAINSVLERLHVLNKQISSLDEASRNTKASVQSIERSFDILIPLAQVAQLELHAAVATLVPRLRRVSDFAEEDQFKNCRAEGEDAENIYFDEKMERAAAEAATRKTNLSAFADITPKPASPV